MVELSLSVKMSAFLKNQDTTAGEERANKQ